MNTKQEDKQHESTHVFDRGLFPTLAGLDAGLECFGPQRQLLHEQVTPKSISEI